MIPLIGSIEEMRNQAAIVRRVADEVFKEKGAKVDYMVGTMIELPRAALTADQIAEEAEFFSFGTNDLTQTTFGISRDDINNFLPAYLKLGIFKQDPFATLDQAGVGQLVKMATAKGRNTRPEPQGRHLRRAWRRSRVRQVLPQDRPQLRLLLALPSADGTAGSGAGGARREARRTGRQQVTSTPLPNFKGVRISGRPCDFVAPASWPAVVRVSDPHRATYPASAHSDPRDRNAIVA